ncbi:hypothetical protein [Maridesulfovibrio zosterae]|uniref:hypothetical protein n=1 Tax=Maridesulfovibrio zosterae TaxID=82171 RepID=UPI0004031D12|nr:hypothetical protein [Maridesulfovibrio zosterae]
MVKNSDPLFNLIYAYTRKQAVEDGNLIDLAAQGKVKGRALQDDFVICLPCVC